METTLSCLQPNKKAKIKKISSTDPILTKKLLSVGLLKGVDVIVSKESFLGDPIEITLRDYNLSLRKYEASQIVVEC